MPIPFSSQKFLFGLAGLVWLSFCQYSCKTQESVANATVSEIVSSESGVFALSPQPSISLSDLEENDGLPTLRIDPAFQDQQYLGFGESFDGSSLYNLARMTPAARKRLLEQMIDPQNGAGFNLFRLCIGSSDFTPMSWGWYSYDDMPAGQTDPELAQFSIQSERDHGVISILKEAMQIAAQKNVSLRFVASPWSPPAWMKDPSSMNGGKLLETFNQVYANYLFQYLKAFKSEGIPIYAITVQNEPGWVTSTPSTDMTAAQEAEIIQYLKLRIDEAPQLETGILSWDWNFHDIQSPLQFLSDPSVKASTSGMAFHAYDWAGHDERNLLYLHQLFPDQALLHTERAFWNTDGMNQIVKLFRSGLCSYMGWVTLLDTDNADDSDREDEMFPGIPTTPYFVLEAGARDTAVSDYKVYPTYYLKAQFSKYIQPGAKRIYSDEGNTELSNVAFLNPDRTIGLVVVNKGTSDQQFRVATRKKQFMAEVPARSVVTFQWTNVDPLDAPQENLAVHGLLTASSDDGTNPLRNAADENPLTRWASLWSDQQWIQIDLGSIKPVDRIVLDWEEAYGKEYLVQVSENGSDWINVYHEKFGGYGLHAYPVNQAVRFVRMLGIKRGTGWGYSLYEMMVY